MKYQADKTMLIIFFELLRRDRSLQDHKQNLRVKGGCCTLYLLLSFYREFTEFNEAGAEGRPGLISRHSHTTHRPTETLSIGQAACVPSAQSLLPCRLSFARALP